tara:strand:+ start:85 stop:186 length:102 start_codon:yes stop_codon:yes gene_type:complete
MTNSLQAEAVEEEEENIFITFWQLVIGEKARGS